MGCGSSKGALSKTQSGKKIRRPVWSSDQIRTVAELKVCQTSFGSSHVLHYECSATH